MKVPVEEWIKTSKWQEFSGFIYGMSYNKELKHLFVAFRHHNRPDIINSLYRYCDVSVEAASRLYCAEDKGRIFHDLIKKNYCYSLIAKYESDAGELLDKVLRDSIFWCKKEK